MSEKYAFRCKQCGRLHEAAHAGDDVRPHACRVCGAGVRFDPRTGVKTFEPDNWEVLAECPPPRLKELGLGPEHVEKHDGTWGPMAGVIGGKLMGKTQESNPAPRHVQAEAREGMSSQDRGG